MMDNEREIANLKAEVARLASEVEGLKHDMLLAMESISFLRQRAGLTPVFKVK